MEAIRKYYRECPQRYHTHMSVFKFIFGMIAVRQLYNLYSATAMADFRDKSALFGRELKPGEPPSWP